MRRFSVVLLLLVAVIATSPARAQEPAETVADTEPQGVDSVQLPANPFLLVTVNVAGASIVVDESQATMAPAPALRIPPGAHVIQVRAEGYNTFEQSIQVPTEGARVDVFLDPSEALTAHLVASEDSYESSGSSSIHKKWWFWAAIGGGVVVIAGVIAAVAIASGGDDGQEVIPVPPIPGGP